MGEIQQLRVYYKSTINARHIFAPGRVVTVSHHRCWPPASPQERHWWQWGKGEKKEKKQTLVSYSYLLAYWLFDSSTLGVGAGIPLIGILAGVCPFVVFGTEMV
jgi:hypothetical protein